MTGAHTRELIGRPSSAAARALTAVAAVTGWFALALQLGITVRLRIANGGTLAGGIWLYLGYFTILTNLLAAAVLTAALGAGRGALGRALRRPGVAAGTAVSILLVGIGYNLLLRHAWHPQGFQFLADELLHDVMPLLFLSWWWLWAPKDGLGAASVIGWALYPVGYFAYALIRGAASGAYPYPFMDAAQLGYGRVLFNGLGLLAGFAIIGLGLVALARRRVRGGRAAEAEVIE